MSTLFRITLLSLFAAAAATVAYAQDTGDTGPSSSPSRGTIMLIYPLNEPADGDFDRFDVFGDTVEKATGFRRTPARTARVRPRTMDSPSTPRASGTSS